MKYFIFILMFATGIQSVHSANHTSAREYVISNLKSLKNSEPGKDSWIKSTSSKLADLKAALPEPDAAFKTRIQLGIDALNEIQVQENDSKILDLFVLASSFAGNYRAHKDNPALSENPALKTAFQAFEHGETDDPLSYFNATLRSVLFYYRHYYPLFNETVPPRIVDCQLEYLGAAYERADSDGPDSEIVYAIVTDWSSAFSKLKTLPKAARKAAISTLEEALDSGAIGDSSNETAARQHLNEAKAFFGP